MKKITALLIAAAMLLSLAGCGEKKEEEVSETTAETVAETVEETSEAVTEEEESTKEEATEEETTEEEATEEEEDKIPETKEEILAAYTEVMDKVKDSRAGFSKMEWQTLPENQRNFDRGELVLDIASNFMTTPEKAQANPQHFSKGDDCEWFPIYQTSKGCMLTDTSAIKQAKCEKLADGNYKITIELYPEKDPEPAAPGSTTAPSNHGAMFSPLSRKDIDNTIETNTIVNVVVRSADYTIEYRDAIVVLVYDPETKQAVTCDQNLNAFIDADIKLMIGALKGTAVLTETVKYYDFVY